MKEFDLPKLQSILSKAKDDREVIFCLLYEILELNGFSNLSLKIIDKPNAKVDSKSFVRACVYGTLTYCYSIDFLFKNICKKDMETLDKMTRTIIRMGIWQIVFSSKVPSYAACDSCVSLAKSMNLPSAGFVNVNLRMIADSDKNLLDINCYNANVQTSLKPEIFGILKSSYGKDDAISIGKKLLEEPKLSVRLNSRKDFELTKTSLREDGVEIYDASFMPGSINVSLNQVVLDKTRAWIKGDAFVQNEAAQLVGYIVSGFLEHNKNIRDNGNDRNDNPRIIDVCAAPGGKSTHIAELLDDECEILSLDINESRVKLIEENAERLGLTSICARVKDATSFTSSDEDNGLYDVVVCDVPCSGLGLMARKPDIRKTITYDRMCELLPIQEDILQKASMKTKKGGLLIYSTCTLNKKENEEQVVAFRERNKNFVQVDLGELLPSKLVARVADNPVGADLAGGYITLMPHLDDVDGFFVCAMLREE